MLLDPEMVIAFSHAEVIARLCADHGANAFAAGWERVSETVFARHINVNGVVADAFVIRGTLQGTPINPPAGVVSAPSPASLAAFLSAAGATPDEIFGSVSARVFRLDDSVSSPHPR